MFSAKTSLQRCAENKPDEQILAVTLGSKISKNHISETKQNTVFKLSVCILGIVGCNPKKIEANKHWPPYFFLGQNLWSNLTLKRSF
jgi:hypothetical protein